MSILKYVDIGESQYNADTGMVEVETQLNIPADEKVGEAVASAVSLIGKLDDDDKISLDEVVANSGSLVDLLGKSMAIFQDKS